MAYTPRTPSFNPYAVGNKIYGQGRSFPTMGPVNDLEGYRERDLENSARRAAMLMSPDYLRGSVF
jgi:hypothetical protein